MNPTLTFVRCDPMAGKNLHDAKCVAACNAQVSAGWFPADEEHAAAHLNQQYYKFK